MYAQRKDNGFTIVELLIVIVIVAILAAIVITAYNGIQARAKATAVESTVEGYQKALVAYLHTHGDYPKHNASFCVGAKSDYPNGCFVAAPSDDSIATALKTQITSLPQVDSSCHLYTGANTCRRNLTFYYQSTAKLDGEPHPYYLMYYLDKDQKCNLSGNIGGSWGNYKSTPNSSGRLEGGAGTSMCMIAMPSPDSV